MLCYGEYKLSFTENDFFQNRSHFSDYSVLSRIEFKDKKGVHQESQYVLICSNWHFVRNHQEVRNCPPCSPEDCNISLKLSSTAFRSAPTELSKAGGFLETEIRIDEDYCFDKNGVIIPYPAFISLLQDKRFTQEYLPLVKKEFERVCGPIYVSEEVEEEEEEEEEEDSNKKAKKTNSKKRKLTNPISEKTWLPDDVSEITPTVEEDEGGNENEESESDDETALLLDKEVVGIEAPSASTSTAATKRIRKIPAKHNK